MGLSMALFIVPHPRKIMKCRALILCLVLSVIAVILFFWLIYPRRTIINILLYHSIAEEDHGPAPSIGKKLFERQMQFLSQQGYKTVFLNEAIERFEADGKVPADWIVLTFDGGYDDFYARAFPVLKKYGLKAVLYVIVGAVGDEGIVTWDQLREMSESGLVRIASHSVTHVPFQCLDIEKAWKEKYDSKEVLEKKLEVPVYTYAYPYGAYDPKAEELVKRAGYVGAVGIVYRRDEFRRKNVYNLRRVYVSDLSRYPLVFRFMISGTYVPLRGLALRVLNIKAPRDAEQC
jgi:peptidoglycan/xylan/chitin deacetylase (PgdA/CDA1 family)